ncbi:MAG: non-canonical purine NTP pyrophosphatase [Pseudomonadota bacterium]
MKSLTFFTSNATKLSHARYIAEKFPINVESFRQKTYHATYIEPRLHSRKAILEASYQSAREQLAKANLSYESHAFILEDTSVRIEALSDAKNDVPGVEIKYWMQENDFKSLDSMIKAAGGNRRAIVRSDVLLHVPKNLRNRWSVDTNYVLFTGTQSGKIVEEELHFQSNLVFPWLDNQTFNKWFCPDQLDAPLGSLSIEKADQYDFRRKSFSKLFRFLSDKGYLTQSAEQMNLPLEDDPVTILLCGYTCAGKTTASQFLSKNFGFLHLEASDFMHLSFLLRHNYNGKVRIGDFAESALVQKPLIAAEKVVDFIRRNRAEDIVVSGFRSPKEVEFLTNELKVLGRKLTNCFVDADAASRFQRMQKRGRPGDTISFEEFCNRDVQQERMGLSEIKRGPNTMPISNFADLDSFLSRIGALAKLEGSTQENSTTAVNALEQITSIGLEDAILLALLTVWDANEDRNFYTTTEVSKLISAHLPNIGAKHKDNVSRYFNQNFYPYYEISSDHENSTRKYRLSNTGYGIAIRVLRSQTHKSQKSRGYSLYKNVENES